MAGRMHCQEVGEAGPYNYNSYDVPEQENYFYKTTFPERTHDVKVTPIPRTSDFENEYNFSHSRRGIAVIITNDTFDNKELCERKGSEHDTDKLYKCFTKLGFDSRVGVNLSVFETQQILKIVAHQMNEDMDFDCFVMAISSHGEHIKNNMKGTTINSDILHCTDGYIPTNHIIEIFSDENCPGLIGKPRLCFIQACRGTKLDDGVELNSLAALEVVDSRPDYSHQIRNNRDNIVISPIPCMKDFLVMYATPPNHYAFRRIKEGSWFILALTRIFNSIKGDHCDLNKLLHLVVKEVAYGYHSCSKNELQNKKKQAPCIYSMLTKAVFLRPK